MTNRLLQYFLYLFIILILFSNCSIKKRSYRKGYYVHWNKSSQAILKPTTPDDAISEIGIQIPENNNEVVKDLEIASIEQSYTLLTKSALSKNILDPEDSCKDIIFLKNGEEINAKIIDTISNEIQYFNCQKGAPFFLDKDDVFKIKYLDGSNRLMGFRKPKEMNDFATMSVVCAAAFILVLPAIPGIICGIIALIQIKKHPEKYTGKWAAIGGIIANVLLFGGWLALIIFLGT